MTYLYLNKRCREYRPPTWIELTFLIVLCGITRIPYPLGMPCPLCHNTVKFSGVISIFILDEAMLTIKKTKRLIILMFLTSKMYQKFFILHLYCIHSALWEFLLRRTNSSNREMWRKNLLEKNKKCLQSRLFVCLYSDAWRNC